MIKKKILKLKRRFSTIFLLFTTLSSILILFPLNSVDSGNVSKNFEIDKGSDIKSILKNAAIGNDEWWNATFFYRRLINITNPKSKDLIDYIVSVELNYTELINENKMNSSLKDVRIVENGVLRDYFVQIDYPIVDLATVWFETNCSSGSSELDTYIYYGNNEVEHDPNYYNKDNRFGLAWYRFDEGTGSSAYDSMGNYGAGSLVNMEGADWEEGRVGSKSLKFDGSNEYVTLPSINPTSAITVSAWIKSSYSTYYSGYWQMISKYNAYILGTWGQGRRMAFLVYTNTWQYTSDFYVPSGECDEWHLFIGTYDSSLANKSIYYDGEFMDDQAISGSIRADTGPITVAKREYNNVFFNGWVDDVRFYDYALSPDEIDGLYNYSIVMAVVQEEQPQSSDVTITTYDIDGRIVPNAVVYLKNYITGAILDYKTTPLNGSVVFHDLELAAYNFTVNYTLSASGKEMVVYDSSANNDIYNFTGLTHSEDITLNLWTIEFDIVDWDEDPLNYAYVNISETPPGEVLESLRLNDGKATFRWKNNTKYYYKIWYDNVDYTTIPVKLNESYIYRDKYDTTNEKFYTHNIWVNQSNILTGTEYEVQEYIYTNGSSQVGNKKLLKANITLNKMTDFFDTVKIYYLDRNGQYDEGSLIYFNDSYSGGQNDFIEINIRETPEVSSNLINDNFEAYGLRIDVRGFNNTRNNGTILVETVESCNIYNKTSMAKLQIRVLDQKVAIMPVQSCIVKVLNSTGDTITNLITDVDGYAHGQVNSESEFWYLRTQPTENYTFILNFYSLDKLFKVNDSDLWIPPGYVNHYNYTLRHNTSLVFKLQIDISDYQSILADLTGDSAVTWGEIMTFSVNYTVKAGADWEGLNDPDEIICSIGSIRVYDMNHGIGDGNFTIAIDSSEFSAGDSGEDYWVEIRGSKLGYIDPEPAYFPITINSIPTGISLYNYTTLNELSTNEISQYYNELINVTFRYYDENTDNPLIADTFTYDWDYGYGSVNRDPMNPDYYTIEIDTVAAANIGKYRVEIIAGLENYTKIDDFDFYINILSRPTSMNGSTGLLYVSQDIYIFETMNFSFNYLDSMESAAPITDADEKSYLLQKLDENGDPISGTEERGSLIEVNSLYVLDLDTELRDDGKYSIIVTLNELNYDHRIAIISLTIMKRVFQIAWDLTSDIFVDSKIEMDSGAALGFTITLTDANSSTPAVIGANIYLTFKGTDYNFTDHGDGTYTVNVPKIADAFFAPETFTATITIEKEYFSPTTRGITIVVKMEEIFGIPTFYFLMIVGSIVAVIGSLATYRIVQQRRIPTFVKKAKSMKKNIKGKKTIADSLLYPSKEQFIVKKFGDKWEKLGLSLEEILGIKGKVKKEKLLEDKIKKARVDQKKLEKEKLKQDKLEEKKLEKETKEQERLEKEKLEDNEIPKERGEEE